MNTQFNANVYCFTEELFKDLLNNFDGKVVGGDGMKVDDVMKHFFGDFVPDKENLVEPEDDEIAPPQKKEKVKKEKDPTKPKRATTAFFFYVATIRDEVKEANPGKTMGELSKIHSKMWKSIGEESTPFLEKAEKDKERYAKEMEAWKAKENAA